MHRPQCCPSIDLTLRTPAPSSKGVGPPGKRHLKGAEPPKGLNFNRAETQEPRSSKGAEPLGTKHSKEVGLQEFALGVSVTWGCGGRRAQF